jgi:hypothetical protein
LNDLERIVDQFLSSLEDLKLESRSVRLPAVLRKRVETEAETVGSNFGEIVICALEEFLERRESEREE